MSIPALFFFNESINYYTHRLFHVPWLYRTFHKWHHRYVSPTLYSTTAMHPLESMTFQGLLLIPMFVVPLHAGMANRFFLFDFSMLNTLLNVKTGKATCTQSTQLRTHCHSREHFMMLHFAIKSWPNVLVDLQQVYSNRTKLINLISDDDWLFDFMALFCECSRKTQVALRGRFIDRKEYCYSKHESTGIL